MSEPPIPTAALRRDRPVDAESGVLLTLQVRDPEVVAELQQRLSPEREQYALTALRLGVIALRQAGGFVDADKLKQQGQLILKDLDARLTKHSTDIDARVSSELKRYFDPTDGHFHEKVKSLVSDDGELVRRLREHLAGDTSVLARQLAESVGNNSPLMQYLSPNQKDGLIERIATLAEARLNEQSQRVLSEFDLNKQDSALNRLIRDVKQINTEIGEKFNPEDDKSVLSRLNKALEATREQIRKDLTLDDSKSSLSKLQEALRQQLTEIADKQEKFQQAVSEQLGIRQVQARTTEGGYNFEHLAAQALQKRIVALGDEFQSVGDVPGVLRRKTGDHLQTLGSESASPGARIVFETKRDRTYRIKKAQEELEEARKNRDAQIGVFVMAAETVRESDVLKGEYPAALARYGNDIIVVWDANDSATDVVLDAAISLARALIVQAARISSPETRRELGELNECIADIQKQFERFESMSKWCDDISAAGRKASDKAGDLKDELRKVLKRLTANVEELNAGLQALGSHS